jgi:hypothetical protein
MSIAKHSTDGTTWSTATFTTTVSGNFVGFENNSNQWAALTSSGQLWENNQETDNLGEFSLVASYPTGLNQISVFNNSFVAISNESGYQGATVSGLNKAVISWKSQTSNFGTSAITSIAYANGTWVAVGSYGQIRTSTNTTAWTTVTSNFGATNIFSRIFSIGYGNGLWVAGGSYGSMRTSTNTTTWTTVNPNFNTTQGSSAIGVAYGNGVWIAVARRDPYPATQSSEWRISTNGSTWTAVTTSWPAGRSRYPWALAYGNGRWVAVGGYGDIITSTNGSTWTNPTSNFPNAYIGTISSIAYGNNLWIAGGYNGQMRTSTDATTWTTVTSNFGSTIISCIAYANGTWVAGTYDGQMRTSTNGSTWTTVNSNFGNTQMKSIAYGNGLWVAAGFGGKIFTSDNPSDSYQFNKFIKSPDEQKAAFVNNSGQILNWNGTGWDEINTGISDNFVNGSVSNSGVYNIVGQNAVYNSTDLTTWTTTTSLPASAINDIIAK